MLKVRVLPDHANAAATILAEHEEFDAATITAARTVANAFDVGRTVHATLRDLVTDAAERLFSAA